MKANAKSKRKSIIEHIQSQLSTNQMEKQIEISYQGIEWSQLAPEQQALRKQEIWKIARAYTNKLRFQSRLQKIAEKNIEEKEIDDVSQSQHVANQVQLQGSKLKWYLVDSDGPFVKSWDFLITLLIIYTMFVSPFIIVFPEVYQTCDQNGNCAPKESHQKTLNIIEMIINIIYFIEILMNFIKKTAQNRTLESISQKYLCGYFIFDVLATIPELFFGESLRFYWLKCFRIIHLSRLCDPLELFLRYALNKYTKKRQNDLISFSKLITFVIYLAHILACVWIVLGMQESCPDSTIANCYQSWIYYKNYSYANPFINQSIKSRYIIAVYFMFEVICTVGYGDYVGHTSNEYIFSLILEFIGVVFFSFLMGYINEIFSSSDSFDDLIEEKLDLLDMWIKKIEKSNRPYYIQPSLYNDIRKYVEQAFLYDFNFIIEEFHFFQQITPKMQTEIIQNTKVFREFERSFGHFFEECERGFINELIINMYTRLYTPGKTIISYKSPFKEMYFIRQGFVEVYNNQQDEKIKDEPIIYLPKFSCFGDYQIFYNLKSNLVFKTFSISSEREKDNQSLYVIFMCVSQEVIMELCDIFPLTAENLKQRSLMRRKKFMEQKNYNSLRFERENISFLSEDHKSKEINDQESQQFYSDEEAENIGNVEEEMNEFLKKLNKKIQNLEDVLKKGESVLSKMVETRTMLNYKV